MWWVLALAVIIVIIAVFYFVSQQNSSTESDGSDDEDSFEDYFNDALDDAAELVVPGAKNRRQNARALRLSSSHPENKVYINPRGRARKCTRRRNRRGKCVTA